MKNFHLPLPDQTYDALRAEAERLAVLEYAEAMAGTSFDLDPCLESASIEELLRLDAESK